MELIQNKYVYDDIHLANEIRLLELLPGSGDSKVAGRLIHRSLDERPEYDALSYMWGDATVTIPIQLADDCDFHVTVNLEKALRDLRLEDRILTLWVDAICINQRNIAERNGQVGFMRTIYEKAATVRTWLDHEIDPTNPPFAKLVLLNEHSSPADLGHDPQFWESVWDIWKNQYWKRLWVQQEIASSRNLLIHCRRNPLSSYSMARLKALATTRYWSGPNSAQWSWVLVGDVSLFPANSRETLPTPRRKSILSALYKYGSLQTTDARDSVYGILGLVENYMDGDIIVDYSLPLNMVCCEVPEFILQRYKSLCFLSFAGLGDSELERYLPSWVPEWHRQARSAKRDLMTAETTTPSTVAQLPSICILERTLNVHGFRVDSIIDLYCNYCPTKAADIQCFLEWHEIIYRASSLNAADTSSGSVVSIVGESGMRLTPKIESFYRTLVENERWNNGLATVFLGLLRDLLSHIGDSNALSDALISMEPYSSYWSLFIFHVRTYTLGKRFLLTPNGTMGQAPKASKLGDEIWILFRCPTPMLLRPENDHYIVVGSVYLDGHMQGEMMRGWPEIVEDENQFGEYTIKGITLR